MGWTGLPDIREVEPLSESDRAVMREVRGVLERHGALGRFGLTLLHSHFGVADDEVLVESVDAPAREITIRPVPREAIPSGAKSITTSWRLDGASGEPEDVLRCFRSPDGSVHML
jgi:hypothetical protein